LDSYQNDTETKNTLYAGTALLLLAANMNSRDISYVLLLMVLISFLNSPLLYTNHRFTFYKLNIVFNQDKRFIISFLQNLHIT